MINICIMFVVLSVVAMILYSSAKYAYIEGGIASNKIDIGVFTYNTIWNGMLDDPEQVGSANGMKCMVDGYNKCQEGMISRIHHYFLDKKIQFVCLQECPIVLTPKIMEGFRDTWVAIPHRTARGMITFYRRDKNIQHYIKDSIHGFFVNNKRHGERPFIIEHFTVDNVPTVIVNVHPGHPGYGDYTYFDKHVWSEIKKNRILADIWKNKKTIKIIAGDWNSVLYNKDLTFGDVTFIGANQEQHTTCCAPSLFWPIKRYKPRSAFDNILCSDNMIVVNRIRDMIGELPYHSDHIGVTGISSIIYSY
jgi:hypothetical protein